MFVFLFIGFPLGGRWFGSQASLTLAMSGSKNPKKMYAQNKILSIGSLYLGEIGAATSFQHNTNHVIANFRDR